MTDGGLINFYAVVVAIVMLIAGMLGSYCRHIFDNTLEKTKLRKIFVPGIVASYSIPLFLSIGRSNVFEEILIGKNFWANAFIIFSFCSLAAVSSRNFVDALSRQALQRAAAAEHLAGKAIDSIRSAEDKIIIVSDKVEEVKDDISEASDASYQSESTPEISRADREKLFPADLSADEKLVMNLLVGGDYARRSISGIARDAGLKNKARVQAALKNLIARGAVDEITSKRTGGLLYQARLQHLAGQD